MDYTQVPTSPRPEKCAIFCKLNPPVSSVIEARAEIEKSANWDSSLSSPLISSSCSLVVFGLHAYKYGLYCIWAFLVDTKKSDGFINSAKFKMYFAITCKKEEKYQKTEK